MLITIAILKKIILGITIEVTLKQVIFEHIFCIQ